MYSHTEDGNAANDHGIQLLSVILFSTSIIVLWSDAFACYRKKIHIVQPGEEESQLKPFLLMIDDEKYFFKRIFFTVINRR